MLKSILLTTGMVTKKVVTKMTTRCCANLLIITFVFVQSLIYWTFDLILYANKCATYKAICSSCLRLKGSYTGGTLNPCASLPDAIRYLVGLNETQGDINMSIYNKLGMRQGCLRLLSCPCRINIVCLSWERNNGQQKITVTTTFPISCF